MSVPELETETNEGIGRLVINRPEYHNALTKRMWEELPVALDELKAMGAKVVVISGSGGSFASGADLLEIEGLTTYDGARDHWFAIRDSLNYLRRFELPTIAKVTGPCIGGGCLVAIACDLRYASINAVFGVPVAKLGLVLDDDNVGWLAGLVGPAYAKELLFSAPTITADRAAHIGLVNLTFAADELGPATDEIARLIAGNSQQSIIEAKRSLARCANLPAGGESQTEQCVVDSYVSPEFRSRLAQARQS